MNTHMSFPTRDFLRPFRAAIFALSLLAGHWICSGQDFWATAAEETTEADEPAATETSPAAEAPAETVAEETTDVAGEAAAASDNEFTGIAMEPEELDLQERIRREEKMIQAEHELGLARDAYSQGNYAEAVELYQASKNHFLEAGNTENIQESANRINKLLAKVFKDWSDEVANQAEALADAEKFEEAISHVRRVAEFNPDKTDFVEERIARYEMMQRKAYRESQVTLERIDPTGEERQENVNIALERGRRLYNKRRYTDARHEYNQVLVWDPFNIEATNGLFQINKKLKAFAEKRRTVTEMERIAENAWKWSEPLPPMGDDVLGPGGSGPTIKEEEETSAIEYKLNNIILPRIDFEEATIHQVIRYLRDKSRELDPDGGKGVSIVFQEGEDQAGAKTGTGTAPAPAPADEFDFGSETTWETDGAGGFGTEGTNETAAADGGTVTIAATDIPLGDAIRFVCESAGYEYLVTKYVVLIGSGIKRKMEFRTFDVPPGMFGIQTTMESPDLIEGWNTARTEGGEGEGDTDMVAYLSQLGIEFPEGSAARLIKNRTKLWVRNTPESLEVIKDFLGEMVKDELQVTIEAKFVEISQNDLEALGFEWLINNGDGLDAENNYAWNNGGKWSYGSWGKSAIMKQVYGATGDQWPLNSALTGALRFANFDPTFFNGNDQVMSLQSILGSMEFTTVIHALNRADSTDVLSCPKVTAKSDETAILRMVTERFFPESWTEPEIESGGTENNSTYKPSIPEFGEARDIGVVLEATPKVDPKKEYLIDLLLRPQVYDFLGYDTDLNYDMIIDGQEVEGKAQMPIIAARTVETSVMVWDGETVVLGGMIQEHLTEYDDKVPVLGDIPLIGRLFQSRGKKSEKRNLLIFVTARLVDPAGRPKRASHDLRGLVDFGR